MGVAGSCRSPAVGLIGEPVLQSLAVQVGEPSEAASLGEPVQVGVGGFAVRGRNAPSLHRLDVGVDVLGDRLRQVLGGCGLRRA